MFMRKTDADIKISIHALVKRATLVGSASGVLVSDFNPRPREEGDASVVNNLAVTVVFQSTPS